MTRPQYFTYVFKNDGISYGAFYIHQTIQKSRVLVYCPCYYVEKCVGVGVEGNMGVWKLFVYKGYKPIFNSERKGFFAVQEELYAA